MACPAGTLPSRTPNSCGLLARRAESIASSIPWTFANSNSAWVGLVACSLRSSVRSVFLFLFLLGGGRVGGGGGVFVCERKRERGVFLEEGKQNRPYVACA